MKEKFFGFEICVEFIVHGENYRVKGSRARVGWFGVRPLGVSSSPIHAKLKTRNKSRDFSLGRLMGLGHVPRPRDFVMSSKLESESLLAIRCPADLTHGLEA